MPTALDVAVALAWDGVGPPRVTAKGRGELAQRILELAHAHEIPIDCEPELVEVLAQVDVGHAVPEKLYLAVAEVLAFAYRVHGRLPTQLAERLDRTHT